MYREPKCLHTKSGAYLQLHAAFYRATADRRFALVFGAQRGRRLPLQRRQSALSGHFGVPRRKLQKQFDTFGSKTSIACNLFLGRLLCGRRSGACR